MRQQFNIRDRRSGDHAYVWSDGGHTVSAVAAMTSVAIECAQRSSSDTIPEKLKR
jgi:hypothetical protein